jgi:outer membrane protein OmpA-like peptidoglycan-associated protein
VSKAMLTTLRTFGLALLLVGCGTTMPPKELNSARQAYTKASQGETAQLAPAQLEEARQALDQAEASFDKKKDKPVTVDLAYIAWRKVQVADSVAALEKSHRQVAAAEKEIDELQEDLLSAAEEKLEMSAQQAAAAEAERKRLEAEKNKTQAELEKERKAREAVEKKLSAALASLNKIASVKEEKRGVVITLSGAVLFATGKYELLPIARSQLADVAKALKDQGYKAIVVEGHTDSRGSDENNMKLSQNRADAVRSYLITQGIESSKITAVGWGESRPIADNNSAEGRANNRRVELVVTPE